MGQQETPAAMLRILVHATALALGAALAAGPEATPQETVREELFVLELERGPALERAGPQPPEAVGVALLRRRVLDGQAQDEWELRFFEDGTRVAHVERWSSGRPTLVWREWRPGGGRTLKAEPGAAGVEVVEWGRKQGLRTSLPAAEAVLLPLQLLELARAGALASGRVQWFDPLARSVEVVEVLARAVPGGARESGGEPAPERRVTLLREDGTSAGEFAFRGAELHAFRWQAGDLSGRRIGREAYAEHLQRCAPAEPAELIAR